MIVRLSRGTTLRFIACLTALAAIACGPAGTSLAQERESAQLTVHAPETSAMTQSLSPAEPIAFLAPSPAMAASETKCDPAGSVYLIYGSDLGVLLARPGGISTLPLSKLVPESRSIIQYPVPRLSGYSDVVRGDFDVSADGHVYALLEALDESQAKADRPLPSFLVAKYKDDGILDSYFKLGDAPDMRIQPLRFAVFRDGSLLVTGTAVKGEQLHPFTAVLDRSGTFVNYVTLSHDVRPLSPQSGAGGRERQGGSAAPAVDETGAGQAKPPASSANRDSEPSSSSVVEVASSSSLISAPDGNVYVVRTTDRPRIYVISPAGDVIRQFDIPAPSAGLSATNAGMAGPDRVFISFTHLQAPSDNTDGAPRPNLISVVNPETGEVTGSYRLAEGEDAFNIPACASAYSFLLVGSTPDRKHLQVTRYVAR